MGGLLSRNERTRSLDTMIDRTSRPYFPAHLKPGCRGAPPAGARVDTATQALDLSPYPRPQGRRQHPNGGPCHQARDDRRRAGEDHLLLSHDRGGPQARRPELREGPDQALVPRRSKAQRSVPAAKASSGPRPCAGSIPIPRPHRWPSSSAWSGFTRRRHS